MTMIVIDERYAHCDQCYSLKECRPIMSRNTTEYVSRSIELRISGRSEGLCRFCRLHFMPSGPLSYANSRWTLLLAEQSQISSPKHWVYGRLAYAAATVTAGPLATTISQSQGLHRWDFY